MKPVADPSLKSWQDLQSWWEAVGIPAPEQGLPRGLKRAWCGEYDALVRVVRGAHWVATRAPSALRQVDVGVIMQTRHAVYPPDMRQSPVRAAWDFVLPQFDPITTPISSGAHPDKVGWDQVRAHLEASPEWQLTLRAHQVMTRALEAPRPAGVRGRGWYPLPCHGGPGVVAFLAAVRQQCDSGLLAALAHQTLKTSLPPAARVPPRLRL